MTFIKIAMCIVLFGWIIYLIRDAGKLGKEPDRSDDIKFNALCLAMSSLALGMFTGAFIF